MIKSFKKVRSVAAVLPIDNIDTDMIIPKQFLKTTKKTDLGKNLFFELRYQQNGKKCSRFVLNNQPFSSAKILITGKNFGCGSSREHAPWALLEFGIKIIIAPSFADIFYNNCFSNGILPIVLATNEIVGLTEDARNKKLLVVNLLAQTIKSTKNTISFQIAPFHKKQLLKGLDSIGIILKNKKMISIFEKKQKINHPWLWNFSPIL